MKYLIFILTIFLSFFGLSQKNAIELRSNFLIGENVWDLSYQKEKSNNFGFELNFSGGNYGTRRYDGTTKNFFGNTYPLVGSYYYDGKEPYSYYSSSHNGISTSVGIRMFTEYNKIFVVGMTVGSGLSYTKEQIKHDFERTSIQKEIVDTSFSKTHINFIFFYNVFVSCKVSKKFYVTTGVNLPFYFMLTNKYIEQYPMDTNSLALGLEPKILIGLKYEI